MNRPLLSVLLIPFFGLCTGFGPARAANAVGPVPLLQDKESFRDRLKQAMRIGDTKEIEKLIKADQIEAIDEIRLLCDAISIRTNDEYEEMIAALSKAWKAVYRSDFVNNVYEFYSLMRPDIKRERLKIQTKFNADVSNYLRAEGAKDSNALGQIGMNFFGYAQAFEQLGDLYNASQGYMYYALCFDERLRGKDADLNRACEGYRRAVENRKAVDLEDTFYNDSKTRFEALEFAGYGDPSKGPAARAAEKKATEATHSFVVSTTFEVFPEVMKVQRPNYTLDEIYQMWPSVNLKGVGSRATFASFLAGVASPTVLREGAAKISVDTDGDDKGDVEVPMAGRFAPVQVVVGDGQPWAFIAITGQQSDTYQGFRYNTEPADDYLSLYVAPAGSVVGMVGETPFRVLDDNMDGVYGSGPIEWGFVGLRDGSLQPDLDSILIGSEKMARPWSEHQQVGDTWYRFERGEDSGSFSVTPTEVKTGFMKLTFKGGKPDWLVVQGNTNENDFFLLEPGKKVELPEGQYKLYSGQLSKGKGAQTAKALILPGERELHWDVYAGETVDVELGSPFSFDFSFRQDDTSFTVEGASVVVTGKAGETYQRLWNCVAQPEVSTRRVGSKKGKDAGNMRPAQSQEELTDSGNDFSVAWRPFDFTEEKRSDDPIEVQLFSKKNKLFGKIESDWKAE